MKTIKYLLAVIFISLGIIYGQADSGKAVVLQDSTYYKKLDTMQINLNANLQNRTNELTKVDPLFNQFLGQLNLIIYLKDEEIKKQTGKK